MVVSIANDNLYRRIHNTSISSWLMNGLNKLECYITPGYIDLPETNTLA